LLRFPQKH